MKINPVDFASWNNFKSKVFNHLFNSSSIERGRFLFRGQANPNWPLSSTFDRSFPSAKGRERNLLEKKLLEHFKKECEDNPDLQNFLEDELSTMALAQHHGLPTRLLDWTESPYIAAFFAFQHATSAFHRTIDDLTENGKVAIWAIDSNHHIWTESLGVKIVSPSSWHNERMRNQFGMFTLSRTPFRSLQEYVENNEDCDDALRLFLLPVNEAETALSDLDLMGINNTTMFADLYGKARTAISKVVLGAKFHRSE